MSKFCFGVDLGGTTVKLGMFDPEGTVLEKWEIPTRKENKGENILPDVAKSIQEKMQDKDIAKDNVSGVGIGVGSGVGVGVDGGVSPAITCKYPLLP